MPRKKKENQNVDKQNEEYDELKIFEKNKNVLFYIVNKGTDEKHDLVLEVNDKLITHSDVFLLMNDLIGLYMSTMTSYMEQINKGK